LKSLILQVNTLAPTKPRPQIDKGVIGQPTLMPLASGQGTAADQFCGEDACPPPSLVVWCMQTVSWNGLDGCAHRAQNRFCRSVSGIEPAEKDPITHSTWSKRDRLAKAE
jgi:hypothetical protein